jgi:hypothetical protein
MASPGLRERKKERTRRLIADTAAVAPEIARLQGIALAGVFQIIIGESGRRTREGRSQAEIADELDRIVGNLLDELDRWFSVPAVAPGAGTPVK